MKKLFFVLLVALILVPAWLLYRQRNAPPEVPFARATRETLVSTLVTNGKVEPLEWSAALAEQAGIVTTFRAARGRRVNRGDVLVELAATETSSELAAAEARLAETRAAMQPLERGGRSAELAALEGEAAKARMDLDTARKDLASSKRLLAKQAATRQDVEEASRRVESAELALRDIDERKVALVDQSDRAAAQAKLREAEAAVELARGRLAKSAIRAPLSGVLYDVEARPGAFLEVGAPVAKVGRMDKVRVRVYVDEPELGRVSPGMPVSITWDALEGPHWQGTVERMPVEITALGTRQVGEVVTVVDNPGGELLPGASVNVEIRSRVSENALTIPREALRRRGLDAGVFLLQGERAAWRKIVTGISSITRTEVREGLSEGDAVALPSEATLADGGRVKPVMR